MARSGDTIRVSHPAVPQLAPDDLARRLDSGEPVQVLDVRAPERLTAGRVTLGEKLAFQNLKGSALYAMPTLEGLGLDPGVPIARSVSSRTRLPGICRFSSVAVMANERLCLGLPDAWNSIRADER